MTNTKTIRKTISDEIENIEAFLFDADLNKLDVEIAIGFIKSETGKIKDTGYKSSSPYLSLAMPSNTFSSALTVCKQRTKEFKELRDVNYVAYKRDESEVNFRDLPLTTALILVSLAQFIFKTNNPDPNEGFVFLTKMHEIGHLLDLVRHRELLATTQKLRLPEGFNRPISDFNRNYMPIINKIDERAQKQCLTQTLENSDWIKKYRTNIDFASNLDKIIDDLLYKLT